MEEELGKSNNNSVETKNLEISDQVTDVKDNEKIQSEDFDAKLKVLQDKVAFIVNERDGITKEIADLKSDNADLKKDLFKENKEAIENKWTALTSKLRDQVECPVCLEVPTSGPVHVCPNGHFVCSKCKDSHCPTCRSKMFSGKSLLAVTVIENIEHKCRNDDCGELFPLDEYEIHLKSCPHRVINCPAPKVLCGKKIALSKVYEHILSECTGSLNTNQNKLNNGKFPKILSVSHEDGIPIQSVSMRGLCLDWNEVKFYLNLEKAPDYTVFSVQLLENEAECKDYEVTIAVHRNDDKEMKGRYVQRLVWDPMPVEIGEEERKKNGLMVGYKILEKITVKDEDKWKFAVTVDFKKVT